jgi:phage anti-repressor protein
MENLNIVSLIEKSPINKLSPTYNNLFLEKIKKEFTTTEQQLFVASFYLYFNYDSINDFIIDLDDTWQWLDFNNKENALRAIKHNFTENTDFKYIDNNEKKEGRGGHNKKKVMLSINTFKSLCFISTTPKAKEIRMYYLKLERIIYDVINEQEKEIKNNFKNILALKDEEISKIEKNKKIERQNILLKQFGTSGALVYLIIVKTFEDGKYILKIGESRYGVKARYDEHKTKYEECILIDCYPVKQSKKFETFIHSHELIEPSKYKELKGHENETELFLIGDKLTLAIVKDVIDKNIKTFDEYDPQIEVEKLKLEIEKIKLLKEVQQQPIINNEILEKLLNKIDNLEKINKEINEKLNTLQNKSTTGFNQVNKTLGPKLQKINPETMQLIKVYDSIAECIKENPKLKRSSIAKAVANNTIYQGFRFLFVDRELDSTKIHNIQPTKKTKIQNNGYVAKLSIDKKEILNVYLDRKTACISNGYTSDSALDTPVKENKPSKGYYYVLYDSCSDELKNEFIKKNNNKQPVLYISGIGQYDEKNILLQEFTSKSDCCRTLGLGDKTVKRCLENNVGYNGKYFKHLETKIKCF